MLIPGTRINRSFARRVNWRILAGAFADAGRGFVWRLSGVAFMLVGLGVGAGAAFYGYAQIDRSSTRAPEIAAAMEEVFRRSAIRAEGEVRLVGPTPTLGVMGAIGMAPDAKVRAEGIVGTQDSPAWPKIQEKEKEKERAAESAAVVTNYTIFKRVVHGRGEVHTGWSFSSNSAPSPDSQYCYYTERLAESAEAVTVHLGNDGRRLSGVAARPGFDPSAAFASCVWFSS